jgi:hypothetical protein
MAAVCSIKSSKGREETVRRYFEYRAESGVAKIRDVRGWAAGVRGSVKVAIIALNKWSPRICPVRARKRSEHSERNVTGLNARICANERQ